jgi:hypothetical protein
VPGAHRGDPSCGRAPPIIVGHDKAGVIVKVTPLRHALLSANERSASAVTAS